MGSLNRLKVSDFEKSLNRSDQHVCSYFSVIFSIAFEAIEVEKIDLWTLCVLVLVVVRCVVVGTIVLLLRK